MEKPPQIQEMPASQDAWSLDLSQEERKLARADYTQWERPIPLMPPMYTWAGNPGHNTGVAYDIATGGGIFRAPEVSLRIRLSHALYYVLYSCCDLVHFRPGVIMDARRLLLADARANRPTGKMLLWDRQDDAEASFDGVALLPYTAIAASSHVPDSYLRTWSPALGILLLRRLVSLAATSTENMGASERIRTIVDSAEEFRPDATRITRWHVQHLSILLGHLSTHRMYPAGTHDHLPINPFVPTIRLHPPTQELPDATVSLRQLAVHLLVTRMGLQLSTDTLETADRTSFLDALCADVERHAGALLHVIAGPLQRQALYFASLREWPRSGTIATGGGTDLPIPYIGVDAPTESPRRNWAFCQPGIQAAEANPRIGQETRMALPPAHPVNGSAIRELLTPGIGDDTDDLRARGRIAGVITGATRSLTRPLSHLMQPLPLIAGSNLCTTLLVALPRPWRYALYCLGTHWVVDGEWGRKEAQMLRVGILADFLYCLDRAVCRVQSHTVEVRDGR